MERSGAERSTGNESFEIVNFRAWFMHGTREERTRAYASSMRLALYAEKLREREREKRVKGKEERRGGVNDREAARSQREMCITEEVLQHPQKRWSKGRYVTRYTDADLPV